MNHFNKSKFVDQTETWPIVYGPFQIFALLILISTAIPQSELAHPCSVVENSGKLQAASFGTTSKTIPQSEVDHSCSVVGNSGNLQAASFGTTSKWVLCRSALSSTEEDLLVVFGRLTSATINKAWKTNVTHINASTNDEGASARIVKYLMGILNGRWILKIDWIKACMEAKHPVDEEPYEVNLDIHGFYDGPKNGRIRILEKAPKLFDGLNFHFCGDFVPSYKGYLKDLVVAAGGNVLFKRDMPLIDSEAEAETSLLATLLIYNEVAPENCGAGKESSVIGQQQQDAEALAAETGSQVATHTWLLDSIAACKLQPLAF